MCQATSGTLKTIASNRCQKYCGLCGSNTAPPAPSTTASTTQTTCIDHEVKCSDQAYINIICSSSHQTTQDHAIAICPKSCNLCTEHFDAYVGILKNKIPSNQTRSHKRTFKSVQQYQSD
ncbi:Hypothetical predicted protein [Mytilus galloprovincialis]|uniref:ShKT domain-containing protein n=1 Tax=Mytilus galloprovincialis TaxID=29158 RepID=A0A8B6C0F4_MYTGA|nr:Hypothetical predicted protein [Mytilus galloprovincialis]